MRMSYLSVTIFVSLLNFCSSERNLEFSLSEIARSDRQWTGIAVSQEERLFVNFPRWSPFSGPSVAEILSPDSLMPYPDNSWNRWQPGDPPESYFVCIQSVFVDGKNRLWILDTGLDVNHGLLPGGSKLLAIDLRNSNIILKYTFDTEILRPDSYLNDVRIDLSHNHAYITDSGNGAIIVLDLNTGNSRRLLDDHYSTMAESIVITVEGKPWLAPDGSAPRIHSDGIALTPDEKYLYFQALTGRNLYRIATRWLISDSVTAAVLGDKVEHVIQTEPADGLAFDEDNNLYISAITGNSIDRYPPGGTLERLITDSRLKWPDSFAISGKGVLYVTTSQIHLAGLQTDPFYILSMSIR